MKQLISSFTGIGILVLLSFPNILNMLDGNVGIHYPLWLWYSLCFISPILGCILVNKYTKNIRSN